MGKLENAYQSYLKNKRIPELFPGAIVLKIDPVHGGVQGFPDLLILYQNKWAALECKRESVSSHRPNQDYYVSLLNDLSYASFIYPENEVEVLNEIRQVFGV